MAEAVLRTGKDSPSTISKAVGRELGANHFLAYMNLLHIHETHDGKLYIGVTMHTDGNPLGNMDSSQ